MVALPGCKEWLWCLPEVSLQGRDTWRGGAQGALCHTALPGSHQIPCHGKGCGWAAHGSGRRLPDVTRPPHHPLAGGPGDGAMLACPTVLQGHLQCSDGWKNLPQGQLSNHTPCQWAARSPGTVEPIPAWRHGQALCLLSLVALACPAAVMPRLLPGMGMSLWDAVSRKQKGLAAPSTRDCAAEE